MVILQSLLFSTEKVPKFTLQKAKNISKVYIKCKKMYINPNKYVQIMDKPKRILIFFHLLYNLEDKTIDKHLNLWYNVCAKHRPHKTLPICII